MEDLLRGERLTLVRHLRGLDGGAGPAEPLHRLDDA